MHLACEALGMALPGSTPVRANSEPMWRAVEQAGQRIVAMVGEDLRPRDILTPAAFANAVVAVLSVSGSINSVKHLQAVAAEARCGAGLTGQVAVVTDGQLSGLVNKGIVVGEVSPEAARGGPLALVRDGDTIRIDVPGRTADLDVPEAELQVRRAALKDPTPSNERGWLSIYQRLVRPLPEGAVLTPAGDDH
jgi:dihydroxyacid dehydratase/phosphogluconate dehydratase